MRVRKIGDRAKPRESQCCSSALSNSALRPREVVLIAAAGHDEDFRIFELSAAAACPVARISYAHLRNILCGEALSNTSGGSSYGCRAMIGFHQRSGLGGREADIGDELLCPRSRYFSWPGPRESFRRRRHGPSDIPLAAAIATKLLEVYTTSGRLRSGELPPIITAIRPIIFAA